MQGSFIEEQRFLWHLTDRGSLSVPPGPRGGMEEADDLRASRGRVWVLDRTRSVWSPGMSDPNGSVHVKSVGPVIR